MALAQVFTISESQDGSVITISDGTGTYDAISNLGGYGSPNTARTDVALIALGKYKASNGDTALTLDTFNPETVTSFTVSNLTLDGYYQFKIYTIDRYIAQPATLNTFVYDFTTHGLKRGNGTSFISATYQELEDNQVVNSTQDWPHIPDLFKARNYLVKLLLIGSQSTKKTDLQQFLISTEVMVYGGLSLFTEGSFTTFQEEIEKYQSRVDTILELT